MELTEKQKMLGAALYVRGVDKQTTVDIMMVLDSDDEVDDLVWYMGQHSQAQAGELLSVAYQLAKEAKQNK